VSITTKLTPIAALGCEISSPQDTCQRETLTSEASLTCADQTSLDTGNAISLLGLAGGPTRSGSQVGPTNAPSGPAPARVSRFRALDSERAMPTNDTSGPLFTALSPSARLQSSLENRLRARMDVNGSPEFALTWKYWDMPSGPPICALRASERRTSAKGFIGWPTPNVPNGGRSIAHAQMKGKTATHNGKKVQVGLEAAAKMVRLVGWDTPTAPVKTNGHQAGNNRYVTNTVRALKGWATPRARDHKNNGVSIARAARGVADSLDLQSKLVCRSGTAPPSPLSARMDGAAFPLNPMHSLWLMGYGPEWESCAVVETRSTRKSPRSSSRPQRSVSRD